MVVYRHTASNGRDEDSGLTCGAVRARRGPARAQVRGGPSPEGAIHQYELNMYILLTYALVVYTEIFYVMYIYFNYGSYLIIAYVSSLFLVSAKGLGPSLGHEVPQLRRAERAAPVHVQPLEGPAQLGGLGAAHAERLDKVPRRHDERQLLFDIAKETT